MTASAYRETISNWFHSASNAMQGPRKEHTCTYSPTHVIFGRTYQRFLLNLLRSQSAEQFPLWSSQQAAPSQIYILVPSDLSCCFIAVMKSAATARYLAVSRSQCLTNAYAQIQAKLEPTSNTFSGQQCHLFRNSIPPKTFSYIIHGTSRGPTGSTSTDSLPGWH